MPSDAEELPRRGEAGHGVVVASMRQEEMRTSSSFYLLPKGYVGWRWAAAWAALVDSCWASCGLLRSDEVQVSLLFFISFIYLLFYFLF
jgi:hypothetical protein